MFRRLVNDDLKLLRGVSLSARIGFRQSRPFRRPSLDHIHTAIRVYPYE